MMYAHVCLCMRAFVKKRLVLLVIHKKLAVCADPKARFVSRSPIIQLSN